MEPMLYNPTYTFMDERKHHWPEQQCYYCGEPATKLCDGINHFLVDSKLMILTNDPHVVEYCDRPLCEDHAERVGMSTASGEVDTVDYCPKHATKMKLDEGVELKQK